MKKVNEDLDKGETLELGELKYNFVYLPYDKDKTTKVKVPKFLINAFHVLHNHKYLDIEGIYRKQGNSLKVAAIEKSAFTADLTDDLSVFDICVLIKRFIKSLKNGLFGPKEERILSAAFDRDGKETPRTLCHFCHTLPSCNFGILVYLIFQLARVVRHSHANKMDAENLAIIFVPVMFQSFDRKIASRPNDINDIKETQETLKATVIMLLKHVTELITPQPIMLRNNSVNRSQNANPFSTSSVASPSPLGKTTPKRSASVVSSSNKPIIVLPRYTHAAAPNVRPCGTAGTMSERAKNKDKTVLRAARRRSKSMLRNVINFVSGNTDKESISEVGAFVHNMYSEK